MTPERLQHIKNEYERWGEAALERACGELLDEVDRLTSALSGLEGVRAKALEEAAKVVEAVSTWNGDSSYCENCKNGTIYPDGESIAKSIRSLKEVTA